jgi:hypothetical protein
LGVDRRRRVRDPHVAIFARKDAEMGESKVARLGKNTRSEVVSLVALAEGEKTSCSFFLHLRWRKSKNGWCGMRLLMLGLAMKNRKGEGRELPLARTGEDLHPPVVVLERSEAGKPIVGTAAKTHRRVPRCMPGIKEALLHKGEEVAGRSAE